MPAPPTGRLVQDQRVDRAINWTLALLPTLALAVGGWYFAQLNQSVGELTVSVSQLRTEIAVARVERAQIAELKDDLKDLTKRVDALERGR